MDERQRKELLSRTLPGKTKFECGMDQYTTFRVGGKAAAICFPEDLKALERILSFIRSEGMPYFVMGKGSNLLVRDRGFSGVAIMLKGRLASIQMDIVDDCMVNAWAGAKISDLLSFCKRHDLAGVEFLAGIPGTVGGATIMNAGAFGGDVSSVIGAIQTMTCSGEMVVRERPQLKFSYRELSIPTGEVIVKVQFNLRKEEQAVIRKRISENLKKRNVQQPIELPSAGSVFKNPPNDYAARLIEEAGLKGTTIGGAMISPKHANYIVNAGNAKAQDILALIALVKEEVRTRSGIELENEIKVIGDNMPYTAN